jgi:polar amino acid transport system substrate-binding protein
VLVALLLVGLPAQARKLKVGISGSPPFVIEENNSFQGISLDVWRQVAEDNGLVYDLVPQSSPEAGIAAVDQGQIDVLVGPISITPQRLAMPGVDFTQPYYLAKSGVLLPLDSPTIFSRIKVFFGWAVISSLLVLISVLLVVGSLIWLAERQVNSEQFPKRWLPGIASGMWFAVVTLTTVGYGDKAPISRTGRGITATWMVISLIAVSSLTASLASAFTLFLSGARETTISSPAQLQQRRVATIEGTSGVELAERGDMRVLKTENLTSGIELLLSEQAEALIFDRPDLRFHLKQNPELAVQLAPFTLAEETYGFVFKTGNSLRNPMNVSILRLQRLGNIKSIANKLLN